MSEAKQKKSIRGWYQRSHVLNLRDDWPIAWSMQSCSLKFKDINISVLKPTTKTTKETYLSIYANTVISHFRIVKRWARTYKHFKATFAIILLKYSTFLRFFCRKKYLIHSFFFLFLNIEIDLAVVLSKLQIQIILYYYNINNFLLWE